MDSTITKFLGIEIGLLAQDQIAVFVDAYASSTQVITEIMVYTVEMCIRDRFRYSDKIKAVFEYDD